MIDELVRLQTLYPEVYWFVKRKDSPRTTTGIAVQLSIGSRSFDVMCRIFCESRKLTHECKLDEFESWMREQLAPDPMMKLAYRDAMGMGMRMVEAAGGTYRRVGSRYLEVRVGELHAWVKFSAARFTRSKAWGRERLEQLYSSGLYAWICHIDMELKKICMTYPFNQYRTTWYNMGGPGLVAALSEAETFAKRAKWRDDEQKMFFS